MSSRPHSSRGGGGGDVFVDRDRSSPAQPQAKHAPPEHPSMAYGAASSAAAASAAAWQPQQPAAAAAPAYHPADEAARRAFEQHIQRFYQQQQQQQQQPFYPPFSPQHHAAAAAASAAAAGYPAPVAAMPPTPLAFDPLRMQQWMQQSHAAAAAGMMPGGGAAAWNGGMSQMPLPLPLPLPPHPSDPFAAYAAAHANGAAAAAASGHAPPPPSFDVEAELLFLSKIERKARSLQGKGHHLMAVELMEQSVASRKMLYGELSDEVRVAAEQLSLVYNSLAMAALYKEEYKTALRLLRKAELLTTHMSELTSVRVQTLNNLACAYRRLARPKTALNLLRESLVLLGTEKGTEGRPVTHLNMCAILSQLGRHDEAIEHAKAAVMHCQKQLLTHPQPDAAAAAHAQRHHDEDSESDSRSNSEDDDDDDSHSDSSVARPSRRSRSRRTDSSTAGSSSAAALSLSHQQLSEKIVILSIAYHNLGVEEEFLLRFDRALHWYAKALQLALEQIGEAEEITATFKRSLAAARKQVEERHRVQQKAEAVSRAAAEAARGGSYSSANTGRSHSRPASAASARSASASRASRPASAASSRAPLAHQPPLQQQHASTGRARPSSARHSSNHGAAAAGVPSNVPNYASATNGSSSRVRPKSASVSRPPRPGR